MSERSSAALDAGSNSAFDGVRPCVGDRSTTKPVWILLRRASTEIGRAISRVLRRGSHYLRAARELNDLDDRDLRDLRIVRADIPRIARDEARRRTDVPAAAPAAVPASKVHEWLLIGSGVVAAAQVGKAIISIPLIRSELAVGLDLAGLIVATFATLGAFVGVGAGVVVRRIGVRRSLIGGMAAVALGNVVGAAAPNELALLAARIIEGIGFFGAVLAIPSMLAAIVTRERRDFVMAVWSAYMPAGIMLMLFLGPLLPLIGWRNLWLANAGAAAACCLLLALRAPILPTTMREPAGRFLAEIANVVRHPRCVMLASRSLPIRVRSSRSPSRCRSC
jgi:hypothetical protein